MASTRFYFALFLILFSSFHGIRGSEEEQKQEEEKSNKSWEVPLKEFEALVTSGEAIVIDVREPHEVEEVRVDARNYINIPLGEVEEAFGMSDEDFEAIYGALKPTKDEELVFICRSGRRSLTALEKAKGKNYEKSRHFLGGTLGWIKNYPERVIRPKDYKIEL